MNKKITLLVLMILLCGNIYAIEENVPKPADPVKTDVVPLENQEVKLDEYKLTGTGKYNTATKEFDIVLTKPLKEIKKDDQVFRNIPKGSTVKYVGNTLTVIFNGESIQAPSGGTVEFDEDKKEIIIKSEEETVIGDSVVKGEIAYNYETKEFRGKEESLLNHKTLGSFEFGKGASTLKFTNDGFKSTGKVSFESSKYDRRFTIHGESSFNKQKGLITFNKGQSPNGIFSDDTFGIVGEQSDSKKEYYVLLEDTPNLLRKKNGIMLTKKTVVDVGAFNPKEFKKQLFKSLDLSKETKADIELMMDTKKGNSKPSIGKMIFEISNKLAIDEKSSPALDAGETTAFIKTILESTTKNIKSTKKSSEVGLLSKILKEDDVTIRGIKKLVPAKNFKNLINDNLKETETIDLVTFGDSTVRIYDELDSKLEKVQSLLDLQIDPKIYYNTKDEVTIQRIFYTQGEDGTTSKKLIVGEDRKKGKIRIRTEQNLYENPKIKELGMPLDEGIETIIKNIYGEETLAFANKKAGDKLKDAIREGYAWYFNGDKLTNADTSTSLEIKSFKEVLKNNNLVIKPEIVTSDTKAEDSKKTIPPQQEGQILNNQKKDISKPPEGIPAYIPNSKAAQEESKPLDSADLLLKFRARVYVREGLKDIAAGKITEKQFEKKIKDLEKYSGVEIDRKTGNINFNEKPKESTYQKIKTIIEEKNKKLPENEQISTWKLSTSISKDLFEGSEDSREETKEANKVINELKGISLSSSYKDVNRISKDVQEKVAPFRSLGIDTGSILALGTGTETTDAEIRATNVLLALSKNQPETSGEEPVQIPMLEKVVNGIVDKLKLGRPLKEGEIKIVDFIVDLPDDKIDKKYRAQVQSLKKIDTAALAIKNPMGLLNIQKTIDKQKLTQKQLEPLKLGEVLALGILINENGLEKNRITKVAGPALIGAHIGADKKANNGRITIWKFKDNVGAVAEIIQADGLTAKLEPVTDIKKYGDVDIILIDTRISNELEGLEKKLFDIKNENIRTMVLTKFIKEASEAPWTPPTGKESDFAKYITTPDRMVQGAKWFFGAKNEKTATDALNKLAEIYANNNYDADKSIQYIYDEKTERKLVFPGIKQWYKDNGKNIKNYYESQKKAKT